MILMKAGGKVIYILCEDSGSGLEFYKALSKIYNSIDCKIISSYGNTQLMDKLIEFEKNSMSALSKTFSSIFSNI